MAITELIQNNPRIAIIVMAFLVTLFITVVNYFMVDRSRMKEIREKQKRLRAEMKQYKDNPQKMMEINKQMMEDMPEQLKHSFKPMLVTIIPLLILFSWLRSTFAITAIASTWFWWYIITSIIFSMILRKAFGLQ
tara:strand:+ start:1156 stop:1560 length:405 start_codon:yes stop_codon:yes gene_type:complete